MSWNWNAFRVGAVLLLGLVAALIIHFSNFGSPQKATPASAPTNSPSATPSATHTPKPSATLSPTASSTPASPSATPKQTLVLAELAVLANTSTSVRIGWQMLPEAASYQVQINGSTIATVTENQAFIYWEVPTMSVEVIPVDANGRAGTGATITLDRPAQQTTQPDDASGDVVPAEPAPADPPQVYQPEVNTTEPDYPAAPEISPEDPNPPVDIPAPAPDSPAAQDAAPVGE